MPRIPDDTDLDYRKRADPYAKLDDDIPADPTVASLPTLRNAYPYPHESSGAGAAGSAGTRFLARLSRSSQRISIAPSYLHPSGARDRDKDRDAESQWEMDEIPLSPRPHDEARREAARGHLSRLRRNNTEGARLQGLMRAKRGKAGTGGRGEYGDWTDTDEKDGDGGAEGDWDPYDEAGSVMGADQLGTGQDQPHYQRGGSRLDRLKVFMVNNGRERIAIAVWVILHLIAFSLSIVNFGYTDRMDKLRQSIGGSYIVSRSAAQVLHIDLIFILFPVCRTFISLLRRTPLNRIIPFDKNIEFHKQVGWAMVFFTIVHIAGHVRNIIVLAQIKGTGVKGFFFMFFLSGPAWTGWVMTISLGSMVWFAMEKRRRKNYERFYYSHHKLFILFFLAWQLHGMFCMIQPDRPPFCSANIIGVFWKYWLPGGIVFIIERILREIRAHHVTFISKVIQHPSNVLEIQIKKEHTTSRPGQYIFINCPSISYFQYHPFTLTSAPEEDYLSVHMRCVGDWTNAFAKSLGVEWDKGGGGGGAVPQGRASEGRAEEARKEGVVSLPIGKVLPRIMVDGPFGSASEDFANYETVLLVGAGIGVTPFASILKSIWYRMNHLGADGSPKTRLSKVYFVWVIRDFGSAEWFQSLLQAVEAEDMQSKIEIHVYLTAKIDEDKMNNILVQDVGAEVDAITGLRAPTHFGRPNWDRVFESIADRHPETDCGVFFCGPAVLSRTLKQMSDKYTSPLGCRFFFGKENF